ncbi:MAG: hypothetical protein FJ279_11365 [Planctomycetes bacterium]|nr:hypothetical protein [Planctomycetota bacterium]MBM4085204.1 hypothetical protein [Planctomycetota bacterium]
MHWIDWTIVWIPLIAVCYIGFKAEKYVQGVSDFMAAGRVAGRYVLAVATAEAGLGLISVVALFEMYYKSGYAIGFWHALATPVGLLMTLTGFAIYRFRETRAMTMAQFFEARYSKSFRIFAGILAYISGVVNYALFPAVGGRFLVYYCQLPDYVNCLGVPVSTYGLVMAMFLIVALIIVAIGGTVDLYRLFKRLKELHRNVLDDGRVVGHVNADDVALVEQVDHVTIQEAHEAERRLADALKKEAEHQHRKTH